MKRDLTLYFFGAVTAACVLMTLGAASSRVGGEIRATRIVLVDSTGSELGAWEPISLGSRLMLGREDAEHVSLVSVDDTHLGGGSKVFMVARGTDGSTATVAAGGRAESTRFSITDNGKPRVSIYGGDFSRDSRGSIELFAGEGDTGRTVWSAP